MMHTLGSAAKATGRAKGTIRAAIGRREISAEKNAKGEYAIDPAELHRVFPAVSDRADLNDPSQGGGQGGPDRSSGWATDRSFDREREALQGQIAALQDALDREKQNADEWRLQVKALTPPAAPVIPPEPVQGSKAVEGGQGRLAAVWRALQG